MKRIVLVALILLAGVGCDQWSKSVARAALVENQVHSYLGDTLRLQLIHNRGAFLSVGASLPEPVRAAVFEIGAGAMLLAMLLYALFARAAGRGMVISAAVVCAGGIGNLIDRVGNDGRVVDFLNVGVGWLRTGIFNLADVFIMAGVIALVIFTPGGSPGEIDDRDAA